MSASASLRFSQQGESAIWPVTGRAGRHADKCWVPGQTRSTRKGTRKLGCYKQALFVLAWFRDKGDIRRLGAGFGLGQSTAYRYLNEGIDVLAAQAPDLREALGQAVEDGLAYLTPDGKAVAAGRCLLKTASRKGEAIDLWYSGKTHDFGGNIQAIFDPRGIPLWISDVLPGNVHAASRCSPSAGPPCRMSPPARPDRRHRQSRARPRPIRAQDDQMKAAGKPR